MTDLFISQDTSSRSIGAKDVLAALEAEQAGRGDFNIVVTGSRGAFFLEPIVEVQTASGRVAYGNVGAADVPYLLDHGLLDV